MSDTVLVTGSSRGIGRAIAVRMAADGFDVVVHCRANRADAATVQQEIEALGRACRVLQFDVRDRAAAEVALSGDVASHGCYFGIVCNAGIARDNIFPAMSGDEWDDVMRTNLDGFFNVLRPLVLPMVRRRAAGRIVTLSSVSGIRGNRGQVNYSAAKAGIIGATRALGLELASRQITVNCVAPGLIATDMTKDIPLERIIEHVPLGRVGTANEVAAAVSFLMSPGATYITRQVLSVDGGLA